MLTKPQSPFDTTLSHFYLYGDIPTSSWQVNQKQNTEDKDGSAREGLTDSKEIKSQQNTHDQTVTKEAQESKPEVSIQTSITQKQPGDANKDRSDTEWNPGAPTQHDATDQLPR